MSIKFESSRFSCSNLPILSFVRWIAGATRCEGNIRMDTVLPQVHIAITGIDKIVPTLKDAFNEVIVQASYAGFYPPAYINVLVMCPLCYQNLSPYVNNIKDIAAVVEGNREVIGDTIPASFISLNALYFPR